MRTIFLTAALLVPSLGDAEPLRVFVSVPPQATFVKKIGGDHVEVRTMVGPGHNPATYDPTPKQVAALARTQLYIRAGVPFEAAWMDRLGSVNPDMKLVDARAGLNLRSMGPAEHGHLDADGRDEAHSHSSEQDPHVWTSPVLVVQMGMRIRDALTKLNPENARDYAIGYTRFAAELDALDRDIRVLLEDLPNRRFMVFHPAWGYFADTYGLTQVPIEKEGKEPGGRALTALIEQAKRENIKVIFAQPQFDDKSAAQVARAIGGRVVAIDPLSASYIENLRNVAKEIAQAMRP